MTIFWPKFTAIGFKKLAIRLQILQKLCCNASQPVHCQAVTLAKISKTTLTYHPSFWPIFGHNLQSLIKIFAKKFTAKLDMVEGWG